MSVPGRVVSIAMRSKDGDVWSVYGEYMCELPATGPPTTLRRIQTEIRKNPRCDARTGCVTTAVWMSGDRCTDTSWKGSTCSLVAGQGEQRGVGVSSPSYLLSWRRLTASSHRIISPHRLAASFHCIAPLHLLTALSCLRPLFRPDLGHHPVRCYFLPRHSLLDASHGPRAWSTVRHHSIFLLTSIQIPTPCRHRETTPTRLHRMRPWWMRSPSRLPSGRLPNTARTGALWLLWTPMRGKWRISRSVLP